MNKRNAKRFNRAVSEAAGTPLIYFWNAMRVVNNLNLGRSFDVAHMRYKLEEYKVNPDEFGISPKSYNLQDQTVLYKAEGLFERLKELDNEGRINLKNEGITDLTSVIAMGFDQPSYREEIAE
jgi:hypothetical protein